MRTAHHGRMSSRTIARDVPTQAIALVLFVFVNFYFIRVVALLPKLNAEVMAVLTIAFAAVWAALLLRRLVSPLGRDRIVGEDTAIIWTGTVLSALFFWLHASPISSCTHFDAADCSVRITRKTSRPVSSRTISSCQ